MGLLASSPILPPIVVLPVAALAMVVIATHTLAIQRATMPLLRRRIRTVNGVLMLFLTAVLAYALSLMQHAQAGGAASAGQTRQFVIVWMIVMGLLPPVVLLAIIDVLNTVRMQGHARRALRRRLKHARLSAIESGGAGTPGGVETGDRDAPRA